MRDVREEIAAINRQIGARKVRREGYADLEARKRDLMTKQLQREIRASKRKAA